MNAPNDSTLQVLHNLTWSNHLMLPPPPLPTALQQNIYRHAVPPSATVATTTALSATFCSTSRELIPTSSCETHNLPSWRWNKIRRREWTKTTCKPNGKWPGEKRRQLQKLSGWRDHSRLVDRQEDKIWQSDCLNIWREIYCCAIASCPWCFMHRKMISNDKHVVFYVYCISNLEIWCTKRGYLSQIRQ